MPSLRKRKLPSGRTIWDIRYWDKGKRKVYSIGETDRRTANKIYNEFCCKHAEGKFDGTEGVVNRQEIAHNTLRLSELAAKVRTYAEANKSPKTLEREQLVFNRLISTLGDITLADLTPSRIEEYKATRLKEVTATTINIEIRVLNTSLNQAIAMSWINESTVPSFKQIRIPESEPPVWLDEEQIKRLLSTDDLEFKQFMQVLLNTGCRRNEALGIRWDDVDLQKRQIVIRGQIGKMGKRRTVPINDDLLAVLSGWNRVRQERLFPNYSSNQVSMKFRRWRQQIGLPKGISIHSLRSTFACHLIKNGVDIYTVSKLLGHSSVKVTEKHYLALDPDHVLSAVNQLRFRTELS